VQKNKIGVAVIGLGRVSDSHLNAIQLNSGLADIAAVVDIDESRAKASAQKYQTKYYLRTEDALNDPEIRAVVICLPHHLHKPIASQALRTGRHVLVEKPWVINYAEGKELADIASKKGLVLMAGQSFRFQGAMFEAKKLVAQGKIGNPFNLFYIYANHHSELRIPPWWKEIDKTGGLLFTLAGPHTIDYTLWIFEGKKPVRIYSEARSMNPELEGMDEIVITIRFDDGSMATNHLSSNTKPRKHEVFIVGLDGSVGVIQHGGHDPGALVGVFSGELLLNGEKVPIPQEQGFHQFAVQMREFLSAIREDREPIVKLSSMLTQIAIIDAAQKAAKSHQPVTLSF